MSKREFAYRISSSIVFGFFSLATYYQQFVVGIELFNQQKDMLNVVSIIIISLSAFLSIVVLISCFVKAAYSLGSLVLSLLIIYFILEGGIRIIDKNIVSGSNIGIGSQHRVYDLNGKSFVAKKSKNPGDFGFELLGSNNISESDVLFIGDSYTEGNPFKKENSYFRSVSHGLKQRKEFTSFLNSGVSGTGPRDQRKIYEALLNYGVKPDLAIWSIFLHNDITDNNEDTRTIPIAGMIQRIPNNALLQYFSPINHYVFRYLVYMRQFSIMKEKASLFSETAQEHGAEVQNEIIEKDTCHLNDNHLKYAKNKYDLLYNGGISMKVIEKEARNILDISQKNKVDIRVIIFPDSIIAQHQRYDFVDLEQALDIHRSYIRMLERVIPKKYITDLSHELIGMTEYYHCNDTHLNDAGNVRAGELILKALE